MTSQSSTPSSAPKNERTAFIVTIDGPAASGKSSVSRELGHRLGWSWVSTGAFYRGLAYIAHVKKADITNEDEIVKLAQSPDWSVEMTTQQTCVFMDSPKSSNGGQGTSQRIDVTDEIGREEYGSLASKISSFPKVRKALLDAQRHCAIGLPGLIAEGRDCGTVVFPQAHVKIFLTARAEDRAARRAKDENRDVGQLVSEQKTRDDQDASRKASPLQAPVDGHLIDTTDLSLIEVVEKVEELVKRHPQRHQAAPTP